MSHLNRKPRQKQMDESREWIAQAFLDLLLKSEDTDRISLSEIAGRAGVSRQTLYRHFSGREEILDWYLEKQFASFMVRSRRLPQDEEYHNENFRLVFLFCRENIGFLRVLIKQNKEFLLLKKLEEFTSRLSGVIMKTGDPVEGFYREKVFAGALFMSIIGWVERGGGEPPPFLPSLLESVLAPVSG